MELFERLVAEWSVIAAAPITFVVLLITIFVAAFMLARLLERREKEATKAEMKLQDRRIDGYKTELEGLTKALTEHQAPGPSKLIPVNFGNSTTRDAFVEITTQPAHTIKFYGPPSRSSDDQIERFAAFARLQEAGLANVQQSAGLTRTITSTSTGSTLRSDYDERNKS